MLIGMNKEKPKKDYPGDLVFLLNFSSTICTVCLILFFFSFSHRILEFPEIMTKIFRYYILVQVVSIFYLFLIMVKFGVIDFLKVVSKRFKFHFFIPNILDYIQKIFKIKSGCTCTYKYDNKEKILQSFYILFTVLIIVILIDCVFGYRFSNWAFAREAIKQNGNGMLSGLKNPLGGFLEKTGIPSLSVMVQWNILLFAIYTLRRNKIHDMIKGVFFRINDAKIFMSIYYFSFFYVLIARIVMQEHLLVDILVSICLGTITYFLVVFLLAIIFKRNIPRVLLLRFTILGIACFSIFILVSRKPLIWTILFFIFICVILPILNYFCREDWGDKAWVI